MEQTVAVLAVLTHQVLLEEEAQVQAVTEALETVLLAAVEVVLLATALLRALEVLVQHHQSRVLQ